MTSATTILNLSVNPHFVHARQNLPVYHHRQEIICKIAHHHVVVISGGVGSGKTTQVPQYILEKAFKDQSACRIACVLPCNLAVLSALDQTTTEIGKH